MDIINEVGKQIKKIMRTIQFFRLKKKRKQQRSEVIYIENMILVENLIKKMKDFTEELKSETHYLK